jgi:hypothetical protein
VPKRLPFIVDYVFTFFFFLLRDIQAAVAAAAGVGLSPIGSTLKPTISLPVVPSVSGLSSS